MTRPPLTEDQRTATRREVAGAAFELFVRNGYDATGVDAIARAAGISTRSFYRYFSSKEDVLDPFLADGVRGFVEAFARRPRGENLFTSAIEAYRATPGVEDADEAFAARMVRLLSGVPALRARWIERQHAAEELLAEHIRARLPAESSELAIRGAAAMIVLALRLPLESAARSQLDTGIRDTQEELLHALTDGSLAALLGLKIHQPLG